LSRHRHSFLRATRALGPLLERTTRLVRVRVRVRGRGRVRARVGVGVGVRVRVGVRGRVRG
jgi:hypothetical protein